MKNLLFTILALFILCSSNLLASELVKVSRVDTKDILQIYFSFDTPPTFSGTTNKRRIDVLLEDTKVLKDLQFLTPDDKIVKVLTRNKNNDLIISLFFRYQPQKYKITRNSNNSVVLEVLLGNEYSNSYKDLANKLKGLTIVDRATPDFTNPYNSILCMRI